MVLAVENHSNNLYNYKPDFKISINLLQSLVCI